MQFQKSTDHAIRILHYLHRHSAAGEELFTAQILSEAVGLKYPSLVKIAYQLKKKDLILTVQGRNGGYQIARPGHEISLYDVVLAIEGDLKISNGFNGQEHGGGGDCALQKYYIEVRETLIAKLAGKSIADFDVVA